MLVNNDKFKEVFEIEWSDFQEKMGNYFLKLLGTTNEEVLETITTLLDETQTGENMFCVYSQDTIVARNQLHFSNVNTYNYLRYGEIKTYTQPILEG